jgi:hypothetical protein
MAHADDYLKFRGKCREMSEAACDADSSLTLVRGWYHCLVWGRQQHWWCRRADGSVYDPTAAQFPTQGGEYEEFRGAVECEFCGKQVSEQDAYLVEHHVYCCGEHYAHDVGF